MKNIHVLPTTQPSRLWINNLLQGKLELSKEVLIGSNTAQHIYVTSNNDNDILDEGVNHVAGSWVLDTNTKKIFKTSVDIISGDDIQKIIITTDQDLIADGIQAIDDIFLEWFVENPSCEEVKIKMENYYASGALQPNLWQYKIIIPQEEPKQETLDFKVWDELFGILAWKFQPTKSGDMYLDAEKVFEELKSKFKLEKL
jgi:hypothetical protein